MKRAAWVVGGIAVVLLALVSLQRNERKVDVVTIATPGGAQATLPASPATSARVAAPAPAAPMAQTPRPARYVIAFRLDPNLTRGLYLGDRWVSPPTFAFAQPGDRYRVHARVQANDDEGASVPAQWATTDPEMVAITPEGDGAVAIVIDRPGTAQLRVSANGEQKILQVVARKHPDAMEVEFRQ